MAETRRKNTLLTLAAAMALMAAPTVRAENPSTGAPGDKSVRLEEPDTMASALKRLEGRIVKMRLAGGGEELTGKIQKVGKDLVHLSDLAGREFYDALIRIDQVAAVSAQVRGR